MNVSPLVRMLLWPLSLLYGAIVRCASGSTTKDCLHKHLKAPVSIEI
jgi:hypothetical protein